MKNVLAIDTSTEVASLALEVNGHMLCVQQSHIKTHAKMLLPLIDSLLAEAGVSISALDTIVFGQGPGSFTGLRIACSIAKGLAYGHDIPLIPVSSLAAIAWKVREDMAIARPVLAVMDARMNELYWRYFGAKASTSSADAISPAADIFVPDEGIVLAGLGFESYREQFSPSLNQQIQEERVIYPEASAMIALAKTTPIKPVSAQEAEPVYIRNKVTQGHSRG